MLQTLKTSKSTQKLLQTYEHRILIMVYLLAATTVTLESSDSDASSVEDSVMDTGKYSMHTYSLIYIV